MLSTTDYYWGMNLIWWNVWMVMLIWIFVVPFDIPGQRKIKVTSLDILQKQFASGQISKKEYAEHKAMLENDSAK